jgi:hypothetical protein
MSEGREIKPDILMAQYREAYEYLRQHSRFMWQVHSLAVVISGGLIVASFAYLKEADLWWVRDLVLLIAGTVTLSLLLAMKKHRYFSDSEVHTLSRLEDALKTKRIQRTTLIERDALKEDNSKPKTEDYWNELKPEGFYAKQRADYWLSNSMHILLAIIIICVIINTVLGIIS